MSQNPALPLKSLLGGVTLGFVTSNITTRSSVRWTGGASNIVKPRGTVFEQHHIRRFQIGNRTRPATNLERNGHKVGLGVKRGCDRLLLREAQANQQHSGGNCAIGLSDHVGKTLHAEPNVTFLCRSSAVGLHPPRSAPPPGRVPPDEATRDLYGLRVTRQIGRRLVKSARNPHASLVV